MSAAVEEFVSSPWLLLPPANTVDPSEWVEGVTPLFRLDDPQAVEARNVLLHYQALETLDGFAARVLFTPQLPGAVLVSIAVVDAESDSVTAQRALLGLDGLGDFNGQLDDLRAHGIEGFQLLRLDSVVDGSVNESAFVATQVTSIRRNLRRGPVDVVAMAWTTDLLLVGAMTEPVIELLVGEDLAEILGG